MLAANCLDDLCLVGWSWDVFWRQLSQFYSFFLSKGGSEDVLPELPSQQLQYVDFALWQLKPDTKAVLADHLKFWVEELSKVSLPVLELPEDLRRPPVQSFKVRQRCDSWLLDSAWNSDVNCGCQTVLATAV